MSLDDEIKNLQSQRKKGISMTGMGEFDSSIYGGGTDKSQLLEYAMDDDEDEGDDGAMGRASSSSSAFRAEMIVDEEAGDSTSFLRQQSGSGLVNTRIADRESEVRFYWK